MRILDAGCGRRNLVYFLRQGFDVQHRRAPSDRHSASHGARWRRSCRQPVPLRRAGSASDACFDLINACGLHFATDEAHFQQMLGELWRVLAPGGLLFTRLASSIGLVGARCLGGRRYRMPDGSERFLVDEAMLLACTAALPARLVDPLKTTLVQGQRCMTTWVLRKA
jgi:SAM-dependent methyltransferase